MLWSGSAWGHECGPGLKLKEGERGLIVIKADVSESEPSLYNIIEYPDSNVAVVLPEEQNLHIIVTKVEASWAIEARGVGVTTVKASWVYAPNDARDECTFTIEVVPEEESEPSTAMNHVNSVAAGDPVNTYTGEFIHYEAPDLQPGGTMNLEFRRFYASRSRNEGFNSNTMGMNWSHNFDYRLIRSGPNVDVVFPGAERISFVLGDSGEEWIRERPVESNFRLRQVEGGQWLVADPRTSMVYRFSEEGDLEYVTDGMGNELILTHEDGVLTSVADNRGRELTFEYSGLHHVSSVSDGTRTVRFQHIGSYLFQVTDARGNETRYEYDFSKPDLALLTQVIHPEGNIPLTQEYDDSGRVVRQVTADEGVYQYVYAPGRTTVTDPLGRTQVHHYDESGSLVLVEYGDGTEVIRGYGDSQRQSVHQLRNGEILSLEHDPVTGEPTGVTTPDGLQQSAVYGSRNVLGFDFPVLTALSPSQESIMFYEYDDSGRVIRFTDPGGHVTAFEYNDSGLPVRVIHPNTGVDQFVYNEQGDLTEWIDATGRKNEYAYDDLRRLARVTEGGTVTLQLEYNADDRITGVTDESGRSVAIEYDKNGNMVKYTGLHGQVTDYTYDSMDRLIGISGPGEYLRTAQYNKVGRPVQITDSVDGSIRIEYDRFDYPVKYVDESGGEWTQEFSPSGDLISTEAPDGRRIAAERDWEGVIRSMEVPGRGEYRFEFSETKDPVAAIDPLGNRTSVVYNALGQLTEFTDPVGRKNEFEYDSLGNLVGVVDADGNQWRYEYDPSGRLTDLIDPQGNRETRSYDTRGRINGITFPGDSGTLSIMYGPQGSIISLSQTEGLNIELGFGDSENRVTATGLTLEMDPLTGLILGSNGLGAGYDSEQRLESIIVSEGASIDYQYNPEGLLTGITDWKGNQTGFVYDGGRRLVAVNRSSGTNTVLEYGEDGLESRRIHRRGDATLGEIRLTRDESGRIQHAERTPVQPLQLTPGSRVFRFDAASRDEELVYDDRGRVVARGSGASDTRYEWDAANRLTGILDAGARWDWEYDPDGRPVQLTSADGAISHWTWNYATGVPTLHSIRKEGQPAPEWIYIYTPGGFLVYALNTLTGERVDYLFDERGNTSMLVDSSGEIRGSYAYDPYGQLLYKEEDMENPFTFQGWVGHFTVVGLDGLVFMRERVYDSFHGRFLSRDPVRRFLGARQLNPYSYARNNPVMFSDPDGRDAYIIQTSSIHTEIAVDIYDAQGNHAGYAQFDFNPVGSAFGYTNQGAVKGVFFDRFRDYSKNTKSLGMIRLPGTQAQDIRLLNKLLEMQGFNNSPYNYSGAQIRDFMGRKDTTAAVRACLMRKMGFTGTRQWADFINGDLQTYGDYSLVPGKSRYCNQFVNEMLGTFFGANWPDTCTLLPGELFLKAGAFAGLGEGSFAWTVIHANNILPLNRIGIELGSTGLAILDSIFN